MSFGVIWTILLTVSEALGLYRLGLYGTLALYIRVLWVFRGLLYEKVGFI
jgi:hypothetical protein